MEHMGNPERAFTEIMQQIERMDAAARFIAMLPDDYPHRLSFSPLANAIFIHAPYSPQALAAATAPLVEWAVKKDFLVKERGVRHIELAHPDYPFEISVTLDPTSKGATCERELVGTTEQPIYQIRGACEA